MRKIEKDKYFVVFQHKYLEELEKDKFSLIEDVKTVKVGNEMAVTLSIGIGYNAGTYNQNAEYARAAIRPCTLDEAAIRWSSKSVTRSPTMVENPRR